MKFMVYMAKCPTENLVFDCTSFAKAFHVYWNVRTCFLRKLCFSSNKFKLSFMEQLDNQDQFRQFKHIPPPLAPLILTFFMLILGLVRLSKIILRKAVQNGLSINYLKFKNMELKIFSVLCILSIMHILSTNSMSVEQRYKPRETMS